MPNPFCEAQRDFFNNVVVCERCALVWDSDELFPPACRFEAPVKKEEKPQ